MLSLPTYSAFEARTLRSHLSLLHGIYTGDVKKDGDLVKAHEASHADPDPHFVMRHQHTEPDDDPDMEEWDGW